MQYTTSADHVIDEITGQRRHDDQNPITTIWSANDGNMTIWSLMEVIKEAGLEGKPFNPADPESYRVLFNAMKKLYGSQATEVLAGLAKIATLEDVAAGTDDTKIITPAKLANALKNLNGAYLTEIRMVAPNFPTPVGWVNISYSHPSYHPVAGMAPEFVTAYYCGDDSNATADFGYRCDSMDGGERNINGAYIALEPAANRFYRGMDDAGTRDPSRLHEDQIQRFSGSTAPNDEETSSVLGINGSETTNGIIKTIPVGTGGSSGASYQRGTIEINTDFDPSLRTGDETVPKHIDKKFIMKVADGAVSDPALVDWQAWFDRWVELQAYVQNSSTILDVGVVSANQRFVMDNPYPGYYVHCEVQIQIDGKWGATGWVFVLSGARGVCSYQYTGQIVIQSGREFIIDSTSANGGNPFGMPGTATESAPCRIIVTRLGRITS